MYQLQCKCNYFFVLPNDLQIKSKQISITFYTSLLNKDQLLEC